MHYRIWFALALVFFGLAIGYLAWWNWMAVPPTPAEALKDISGTLARVEDVSRSAGPVHPVLDVVIDTADGGKQGLHIRNRDVTVGQFRAMIGHAVRVRYSAETGVIYAFVADGREVIGYDASFRQEMETYDTLNLAAKLAAAAGVLFALIGALMYFRRRRRR